MNDFFSKLPELGIAAAMLYWFTVRLEGIMLKQTRSNDRLTRSNLMVLQSLKNTDATLRAQSGQMLEEMDRERADNDE